MISGYKIIGKGIKSNLANVDTNIEKFMKVYELKSYIRENFIKDMIQMIANYMSDCLIEVSIFFWNLDINFT